MIVITFYYKTIDEKEASLGILQSTQEDRPRQEY